MINAVVMMLVLGTALGLLLAVAGKFLYVEVDNRVEVLQSMLPGLNCGACGFPGCAGLANALASGEVKDPAQCKPSNAAHRARISAFLETGVDPDAAVHQH